MMKKHGNIVRKFRRLFMYNSRAWDAAFLHVLIATARIF